MMLTKLINYYFLNLKIYFSMPLYSQPIFVCVFILFGYVCNAPYVEHNISSLTNALRICEFMLDHIHLPGTDEIDTVQVYANDMLKTIWSREIRPYGPNDEVVAPGVCYLCGQALVDSLQKMCFRGTYSDNLNKKVDKCLSNLVQKMQPNGSDLVIKLQVERNELEELQNIIRTGCEFASRIVYSPSFELDEDFFHWLILSSEGPSAYSMIEDVGIATVTLGPWIKEVLTVFLQEKYFGKLIFDTQKGTPYWEMTMDFPSHQRKVVVQLCQWPEFSRRPQKLRIMIKKLEETLLNRVDELITDITGKNVCF